MTPEERRVLEEAQEQAFETSKELYSPETSGIRPPPVIQETITTIEGKLFGLEFPEAPTSISTPEIPPPDECTCPREVSEISGFTMSFTATYIGDGVTSCEADTCSATQTWTRIDSDESFSAPHQFKLYLDNCGAGGQIFYEDNREFSPIGFDCLGGNEFPLHGSFVYGANSPNTGGCCNFITTGDTVFYNMDFFAEGDNLCSFCVAELGDTEIEGLTICDMSSLIGEYPISRECEDMFGGIWQIDALLEWF